MKTLTGRLPLKYRSAARFVLVGALGTGLQYGIYYLLLMVFQRRWPDVDIGSIYGGVYHRDGM